MVSGHYDSYGDGATIVGEADRVLALAQAKLDQVTQLLEPTRPAAAKARDILRAFFEDACFARRQAGPYLEQNSRDSLDNLTRIAARPSLAAQLEARTWPGLFHRLADWLVCSALGFIQRALDEATLNHKIIVSRSGMPLWV